MAVRGTIYTRCITSDDRRRAAALARICRVEGGERGKPVAPLMVLWDVVEVSQDFTKVALQLTDEERGMLVSGLNEWGGPADGTELLAAAMGLSSMADLDAGEGERILDDIAFGRALSVRDWTRALLATEIAFASAVLGAANEWEPIHGESAEYWIGILRSLQRKVPFDSQILEP